MLIIRAYRFTLRQLLTALTKGYEKKAREETRALAAAAEATQRAKVAKADALDLRLQAIKLKTLLG